MMVLTDVDGFQEITSQLLLVIEGMLSCIFSITKMVQKINIL